jgi:hypothetical protein
MRKVFIVVKTYPTLSKKYDELVCTAGILDDGSWVRIYPLPFRKLDYETRYKKYQWMTLPLLKNLNDPRPESYKVSDISKISLSSDLVSTKGEWAERKKIIFEKNTIYRNLDELIKKANNNELSIAIFKPTKILEFVVKETEREWSQESLDHLKQKAKQFSLFDSVVKIETEFLIVDKLPYKFSYHFRDDDGRESTLMIEDWEIGALYWNCLKSHKGDEKKAINLVRKKYWDEFSKKDIYLFLGTTRRYHGWANNPFVIIGVFYPPRINQNQLMLGLTHTIHNHLILL